VPDDEENDDFLPSDNSVSTFRCEGEDVLPLFSLLVPNYHPQLKLMSKFYLPFIFFGTASYYVDLSCHIFLDSTWTSWLDVCNDKNHVLIIGAHSLCTQATETFTEANHFHDVFVGLGLILDLMLEPYSVSSSDSWVTDSLMKLIKDSSAPNIAGTISSNSFGKVNKKSCHLVIDVLSVQLVFDNWYPFASQSAPSPYVKDTPQDVIHHITHNQNVLLSLYFKMNPLSCMYVFKEAKSNRFGWPVPSLKKIFSSAVMMKHKLDKGIILSWDGYAHNTVSEFLLCFLFYVTILFYPNLYFIQECMWIHHWVILQFVNPLFSVPIHYNICQVGPNGFMSFDFKHNNWDQFTISIDNELELEHHNCHGEVPRIGLVWLGMRVDE
jgi:hypothetical protein